MDILASYDDNATVHLSQIRMFWFFSSRFPKLVKTDFFIVSIASLRFTLDGKYK